MSASQNHEWSLDVEPGIAFSVDGPLPRLFNDVATDCFSEDPLAQGQYQAHRSTQAHANTVTYHALDHTGCVCGFISFLVGREDDGEAVRIFASVEYIYVMQNARMRGVSKLLLSPLIRVVQTELNDATGEEKRLRVQLYSSSLPQSAGGVGTLQALDRQLGLLVRDYDDVELISRRLISVPRPARALRTLPDGCQSLP